MQHCYTMYLGKFKQEKYFLRERQLCLLYSWFMSSVLPFNVLRCTSLPSAAVDYASPVEIRVVSGILQRVFTDSCCSFVLNIL